MAMICVHGSGECDGCMKCQPEHEPNVVGFCVHCGEPIYSDENRYEFSDVETVHDECAVEYIREHYYRKGE